MGLCRFLVFFVLARISHAIRREESHIASKVSVEVDHGSHAKRSTDQYEEGESDLQDLSDLEEASTEAQDSTEVADSSDTSSPFKDRLAAFEQAVDADGATKISFKAKAGDTVEYAPGPCSNWTDAKVLAAVGRSGKKEKERHGRELYGAMRYKIQLDDGSEVERAHASNMRSLKKVNRVDLYNMPKGSQVEYYNSAYTSPDDMWLNAVTTDPGERKPWPIEGGLEVMTTVYPVKIQEMGAQIEAPMWMFRTPVRPFEIGEDVQYLKTCRRVWLPAVIASVKYLAQDTSKRRPVSYTLSRRTLSGEPIEIPANTIRRTTRQFSAEELATNNALYAKTLGKSRR